jgi:hypothetical protein
MDTIVCRKLQSNPKWFKDERGRGWEQKGKRLDTGEVKDGLRG